MSTTKKATNRGTKIKADVFATGCDPATLRVTTWENTAQEAYTGHCAELKISRNIGGHGLAARGYAQPDNALEALAVQLEAMAAKVRAMKSAGTGTGLDISPILNDLAALARGGDLTPEWHRAAIKYARAHAAELVKMDLRIAVDTCLEGK